MTTLPAGTLARPGPASGSPLRAAALLIAACLLLPRAHADSITLRRSLAPVAGRPITLADAAILEGPAALTLGPIVLADSAGDLPAGPGGVRLIDVPLIRGVLDAQPGINWAFLTIRGSAVRVAEASAPPPRASPAPESVRAPEEPVPPVLPGTIRELAHRVLLRVLGVEPEDLRVAWPDRDAELLDQPVAGRTIHVQPVGSSSRMPLAVTIYDGDRIVRAETVRAEVAVRRDAWVVARPVSRGDAIDTQAATPRVMWLEPGVSPAAAVVGQHAARRLEPGSVVQTDDVTPPNSVQRGEVIMLHCVAGAVAIKTRARALAAGRDGEIIQLEMEATGKRVTARVSGPGKAVLVVAPDQPQGDAP